MSKVRQYTVLVGFKDMYYVDFLFVWKIWCHLPAMMIAIQLFLGKKKTKKHQYFLMRLQMD